MELRRIDPLSCAKVTGILYGAMGLLIGGIFSLISVMGGVLGSGDSGSLGGLEGLIVGAGAVIFLPIFYGVLGAVFSALGAFLYNLVARNFGGIEVDLS
ncbi:MAG: DUF3566 domain-containing protein [Deltaproteobacteria bacterium]|nr:DUF3566 domain-containing protein [Deltaproteobacteria bacterium]